MDTVRATSRGQTAQGGLRSKSEAKHGCGHDERPMLVAAQAVRVALPDVEPEGHAPSGEPELPAALGQPEAAPSELVVSLVAKERARVNETVGVGRSA
jgi:hypothetical protein